MEQAKNRFMQAAIDEALYGIEHGHGGPFGSVIVKDGNIIAKNHNRVIEKNDPTCHGEMEAIRTASQITDSCDLSGCESYTTGEPCPMCLFACLWAKIDKVYYGCTIEDNSAIGFRDMQFHDIGDGREKLNDYLTCTDREACLDLFYKYSRSEHTLY